MLGAEARQKSMPRSPRLRALHTLVLLAFALALPLFEMLQEHASVLKERGFDALDLVVIAVALIAVVPGVGVLVKWGLETALPRAAAAIHLGVVGLLLAVISLQIIREGDAGETPGWVVAPGMAVAGWVGARVYARARFVPVLMALASLALVGLPLEFLVSDAMRPIARPPRVEAQTAPMAGGGSRPATPVVVTIFDGLPLTSLVNESGQIDAARFPHLAALAEGSHFFGNASTVAADRVFALPALATGRYPAWERPPTVNEYPQNLFTLLGSRTAFNVVEPFTQLCPRSLCHPGGEPRELRLGSFFASLPGLVSAIGLPDDWARRIPATAKARRALFERRGDDPDGRQQLVEHRFDPDWLAARFLAGIEDHSGPALHFLHTSLPDSPYRYLPSGLRYRPTAIHPDTRLVPNSVVDLEWAEIQGLQRQLMQIAFADALLGRIRASLESAGLYERALWVVTATRGTSLRPRTPRTRLDADRKNAADILMVPLLVKLPGQTRGETSTRNVETIDVLPTILDALGLAAREPMDGIPLFAADATERQEKIAYGPARASSPLQRERIALAAPLFTDPTTVRRITRFFGRGEGTDSLFRAGPYAELLGHDVASTPESAQVPYTVTLGDAAAFEHVDRASGFVPAHVTGILEGDDLGRAPIDLAVGVNGSIRAVTRSYRDSDGSTRFSAMVPADAFREGRNQVQVFVIRKRPRGVVLVQTASAPNP
jgi:hypothetical protein